MEDLLVHWFELAGSYRARSSWMTIFYATVWSIWIARNKMIFEGREIVWDRLLDTVLITVASWIKGFQPDFPFHLSDFLIYPGSIQR
ncbi:hypothetical protein Tsubulata_050337 [Turnera subulata]|uniref:Uncharacterized protein n=1 Tax=Turnera subulata TaxID=218843 RepID=A0A9Q0FE24_9ROSI|nr:hypothetical protein Tsubulata_050337 [Turnera subulata]